MLPVFPASDDHGRERALRERFAAAAQNPAGLFSYPTGAAGLAALAYPSELLAALPGEALTCYCGVGNPFEPETPHPGEAVLDIGCGAGVDALVASRFSGPGGLVVGLEFSLDMLRRAARNIRLARTDNVVLAAGRADSQPFADSAFDRVISNGVFNLLLDKSAALAESFRVLKPGAAMVVADQAQDAGVGESCPLPPPNAGLEERVRAWAR